MRLGTLAILGAALVLSVFAVPNAAADDYRPPDRWPVGSDVTDLAYKPLCVAKQVVTWTSAGEGLYDGHLNGELDCTFLGFDLEATCGVSLLDQDGNVLQHTDDWLYRDVDPCELGTIDFGPLAAADRAHRAKFTADMYIRGPYWAFPTLFCPSASGPSASCSNDVVLEPGRPRTIRFQ